MEVAFYTMANAYEAVVYIASEDADLKTKAANMKAKFAQYETNRDDLEAALKAGHRKLAAAKQAAEDTARDNANKASIPAAISASAANATTAAAAGPTSGVSSVYYEALKPKTLLSTDCRPDVYLEWKQSLAQFILPGK